MKRLGRIDSNVYNLQFRVVSLCEALAKKFLTLVLWQQTTFFISNFQHCLLIMV